VRWRGALRGAHRRTIAWPISCPEDAPRERTALFGDASPSYSITRRASSSASLRAPSASGSLTLSAGISAEALTELLEALGLIRCWRERESQDEIIEVDKFVQGVCPPGSF